MFYRFNREITLEDTYELIDDLSKVALECSNFFLLNLLQSFENKKTILFDYI